jgi:tetratricopeptide (TPR) repeat protein
LEGMGRGRYRYHDLMRLYAKAMLEEEAVGAAEEHFFEWCCQRAGYFGNAFDPLRRRRLVAEQNREKDNGAVDEAAGQAFVGAALSWFELERLNWLAAFDWGRANKKHQEIVALAANAVGFFLIRGYWRDWEETHVWALAAARKSERLQEEGVTLNNLGLVYDSQGRWADAITHYKQSLKIFCDLDDRHGEGAVLNSLGLVYDSQGLWVEAIIHYKQSLKIFRDSDDRHGEGAALNNLGNVYQAHSRWVDASIQFGQSLEIFRSGGDRYSEAQCLMSLGNVYRIQGLWVDAITHYKQSFKICCSLANRHGEGICLMGLGNVYKDQGDWANAITQYEQSLEILRSMGDRPSEGGCLMGLGNVYKAQGDWVNAISCYNQSLEMLRSMGDRHDEGGCLMGLGNVYKAQGDWANAISCYNQSSKIYQDFGDQQGEGQTLLNLGNLYRARFQPKKANAYWQEALTKLHADSLDAKRLTQQLQHPFTAILLQPFLRPSQITLLIFAAINLFRGHCLLALLVLLAWASFVAIRLWRIRRGKPS